MMMALYFHPHRNEKVGTGAQDIKVRVVVRRGYIWLKVKTIAFIHENVQRLSDKPRIFIHKPSKEFYNKVIPRKQLCSIEMRVKFAWVANVR